MPCHLTTAIERAAQPHKSDAENLLSAIARAIDIGREIPNARAHGPLRTNFPRTAPNVAAEDERIRRILAGEAPADELFMPPTPAEVSESEAVLEFVRAYFASCDDELARRDHQLVLLAAGGARSRHIRKRLGLPKDFTREGIRRRKAKHLAAMVDRLRRENVWPKESACDRKKSVDVQGVNPYLKL